MIDVPPVVAATAAVYGADAWLDALPALVTELERTWSITVGAAFLDATEAFVAEAMTASGGAAVVKIPIPRPRAVVERELTVLRLAGTGCVTLLRDDAGRGAMLLERLGPSMSDLALPIDRRHELLADAAARVWRPAPEAGLPTGATKARWLAEQIAGSWERLGRPCSGAAVAHALDCAQRRIDAHDDGRAVLVHGDVHQWNALRAADGSFRLVDPDGLLAEPEYDLGVMMREDPEELMTGDPFERAAWLGDRTDLDPTAIWEWGVVERVANGLLWAETDLEPHGRQALAAADRIASLRWTSR